MYFPVAGIELNPLVPILVGVTVSLVLGQVGLTGGIFTLPFMMSVLNFTSPSVNSTNLIFVFMSPFGSVYSYWRERRILWRLGFLAAGGGIIGSFLGPLIRVGPLNDNLRFKTLFGILLALMGLRLFLKKHKLIKVGKIERTRGSLFKQEFVFSGQTYAFSSAQIFLVGILVGAISTTFGLGTGFLLVPFYTTVLKFPIHAVASSALLSTLIISSAGVLVYSSLNVGVSTSPDLMLGVLLGIGGIIGGYLSAKAQRVMSTVALNKVLGAILFLWAILYLKQGF
jgi:uncharacterized membrane protein YfcA